jgi:hypothetical protein
MAKLHLEYHQDADRASGSGNSHYDRDLQEKRDVTWYQAVIIGIANYCQEECGQEYDRAYH